MQPKQLIKFTSKNIILFTLAFLLTFTPSTFAKQPENSIFLNQSQTIKSPATNPQQLLQQGEALYQAGNLKQAIAILQQALLFYQQENHNLGQAAALTNLSVVYQRLGAWKEADEAVNNSLNLLGWDNENQLLNVSKNKSELWEIIGQTLDIQAGLLLKQGKPQASLQISQQAEQIWKKLDNNTGVTRSRINQAQALRVAGFYRRSRKLLEEISQQLKLSPDSIIKVSALRSLGNTHQQLGNLEDSQRVLKRSLIIAQRLQLPQEIALTQFSLGNNARSLGQKENAIVHYQKAALATSNSLTKVQAQINQLSLLVEKEETAEEKTTEEEITQAKKLIPTIQSQLANLPGNQTGIYARINFARTLTNANRHLRKRFITDANLTPLPPFPTRKVGFEASLLAGERFGERSFLFPEMSNTKTKTKIGNFQDIAQILATSVQQAKTIGDKRAESYALGSLGQLYEQSNQLLEARDLTTQALFLVQKNDASDIAYLWEWQLGRLFKKQNNIPAAISAYDSAVTSLDLLRNDLAAVNREVQFNFRDTVEPIYRQSVEILLQEKGDKKPDLDKVRQRIEALQLAELDNYFREACLNNQFVVLDEVVDRDNTDTAIFYPIILDKHLEVIVKIPGQKQLIHKTNVIDDEEVEQTIAQMREYITELDRINEFQQLSQKLYKLLIEPVETELENSKEKIKTLIFIPDGSLRNIPMAALFDGKQYLVEKYAIAISPGLQLFTPKSFTGKQLNALAGGLSEMPEGEYFAPLPNVRQELASIEKSGVSTVKLYNQEFRSDVLAKQINAQPFQIVHLATHGQFSSNPNETFLLASDKRIKVGELDNLLKSREQKRTEPIFLLVLSACETAAGDKRAALGLAGIALSAGARSTLASLWQINDESTAYMIEEFYRQLMDSKSKTTAEALRKAQLKLMKIYGDRPSYWAPYVLVGNWL